VCLGAVVASQSQIAARVCSVISNWTGLPVFRWITAVLHPAPDAHVVHPQPHEVAAPQLAIDGEIEQSKVASALFKLEPDADWPNLPRSQRTLLTNQAALVPGRFGKADERWDRGVHGWLLDPARALSSAGHPLTRTAIIHRRRLQLKKADLRLIRVVRRTGPGPDAHYPGRVGWSQPFQRAKAGCTGILGHC
jgi:hypothetical protein